MATLTCPACKKPLRPYQARHLCDGCQGMFLDLADLKAAIADLTGVDPTFEIVDAARGLRACPVCQTSMSRCHLRVVLGEEIAKPRPELDSCKEHGIWFDKDELASVFEKSYAKVGGRPSVGSWKGAQGVPEWWGGGGGGKL